MDFTFTEEQASIRETIQKFITKELKRDEVRKRDESMAFPADMFKTIRDMGFCGLTVPEAWGGGGPNTLGAVLVAEELSSIYPALAAAFIASTFCGGNVISAMGSPEQKNRFLPELAQGSLMFSYALREPGDAYGRSLVKTTAARSGKGFLLNGEKAWVRLADRADYLVTLASTIDEKNSGPALSVFIVDAKAKGIAVHPAEKIGFDSMSLCRVTFEGTALTDGDILGGPGMLNRGGEQFEALMDSENLEVACTAVGLAQGAYAYASQYSKERIQFGKPIVDFGAVKHMLVDSALKIKSARLLAYQAASLRDRGIPASVEAAMARVSAVEAAHTAALNCVQVLGGYGYAKEYDAQRYMRDALVLLTGGEPVEVIKDSIGAMLSLSSGA